MTMDLGAAIRRGRAAVARAAGTLRWYYRSRPDALHRLATPGVGVVVTLVLSLAWGAFGALLALLVVGTFAAFSIQLVEELRAAEAEATSRTELSANDVPWLAHVTEEVPSQLPETQTAGPDASPMPAHLPELPAPPISDASPENATLPTRSTRPAEAFLPAEPVYELREISAGAHRTLETKPSFLEAWDVAFQVIEDNDPAELEIVRLSREQPEPVWSYRRSESAAKMDESAANY